MLNFFIFRFFSCLCATQNVTIRRSACKNWKNACTVKNGLVNETLHSPIFSSKRVKVVQKLKTSLSKNMPMTQ